MWCSSTWRVRSLKVPGAVERDPDAHRHLPLGLMWAPSCTPTPSSRPRSHAWDVDSPRPLHAYHAFSGWPDPASSLHHLRHGGARRLRERGPGETHNATCYRITAPSPWERPEEAFSRTVVLEEMAEIYYRTRVAGEPILLSPSRSKRWRPRSPATGRQNPCRGTRKSRSSAGSQRIAVFWRGSLGYREQ